jgi:hypothetical protein
MNMILLLSILAVIGAMPIFLLVSAITRSDLKEAQVNTMTFLERWGGIAPESVQEWIRKAMGATAGFALLVALAATFNKLGDGPIIPILSGSFGHFGAEYTQWSEAHQTEWEGFRDGVRVNWVKIYPDENLVKDPDAWDKWKRDKGKDSVRVPRTLVFFSFIILTAGLVDLTNKTFRRRGVLLVIIGALSFMSFLYIWADRKDSYIHAVFLANETLEQHKLPIPPSFTASYNVR